MVRRLDQRASILINTCVSLLVSILADMIQFSNYEAADMIQFSNYEAAHKAS